MKTVFGKLPGSSATVRVDFGELIQNVDDVITRAEAEAVSEYISPGFIDIQVNGFAGVDFNNPGTPHEDLRKALRQMARTGVTRCLPTVITGPAEQMSGALRNLASAKEAWQQQRVAEGSMFAAFHMEGPHISPEDGPRGAHPKEHVRPPDTEEFDRMQEAALGHIRLVTVSPEWPKTPRYIGHLIRQGVVASIGHTKATADQIQAAVDAGASVSTHLGNGAHATLPKTQNYIWEQLANDKLTAGFIADGIHLPDAFFRAAVRAKGLERCLLITDAVAPALCRPGRYQLGGMAVDLRADGRVVLQDTERLAGSSLRMDRAIENTIRIIGTSLQETLALATSHPARAARIAGRLRGLSPGEKADFVRFLWDPSSRKMNVVETIVAGETISFEAADEIAASL
ncbi:MAG TPA: amidohydrolase family protein [Bryobacteraceae bacterium]|jgi:N-acetylglucosamine-6-phosphate deacetylase|nr:amidohydrolase family protein [Bryobacteraceae bacterium]